MKIFPAIDLMGGRAVRLLRGDYGQATVYDDQPVNVALAFRRAGCECLHMVDLEGARDGGTPNMDAIRAVVGEAGLFTQLGGGIRDMNVVEKYLGAGIDRVILGTAAVTDPGFAQRAIRAFGERIAVGADIRDGRVAVKGWTEQSEFTPEDFLRRMGDAGAKTVIVTDISKDGAMAGTNRELYRDIMREFDFDVVASGGVSSLEDVRALRAMNLYGAIIGKAYYTGAIDLGEALEAAK